MPSRFLVALRQFLSRRKARPSRPDRERKHRAYLSVEALEDRTVPAVARGAFAHFEGDIPRASALSRHDISINTRGFRLSNTRVAVLGFEVRADAGSRLDPNSVLLNRRGGSLRPSILNRTADTGAQKTSYTVGMFHRGLFRVQVRGEGRSAGRYEMDVFLAGDLDRNFVVSGSELTSILRRMGVRRGQSRYLVAADVDRNGTINLVDYNMARLNANVRTFIRPMSRFSFFLTASADPDRDDVIRNRPLPIYYTGVTAPRATVQVDVNRDGRFDSRATARATGRYFVGVNLRPGLNRIAARATDPFGQFLANRDTVTFIPIQTVTLDLSPADDRDDNDRVVASTVRMVGQTNPGSTVELDENQDGVYDQTTTASSTGSYQFTVNLPAVGVYQFQARSTDGWGQQATTTATVTRVAPSLTVQAPQVMANTTEQIIFRVENLPGLNVRVYLSDAAGNVASPSSDMLFPLLDNGNPANRDAIPNDGIYAETGVLNFGNPGVQYYAAITNGNFAAPLVASITILPAPSSSNLQTDLSLYNSAQQVYDNAIQGGQTRSQALDSVRTFLLSQPIVVAGSIQLNDPSSIFWSNSDGTRWGVNPGMPGQKSGGGRRRSGGARTYRGTDPCAQALVLAPFYNASLDESDEIVARLRNKGYTVNWQWNSAVTLQDFKNLDRYDAIVISSHGENDRWYGNQTGSLIITSVPATLANLQTYRQDIIARRVTMVDGYLAATHSFFTYYTTSLDKSVAYISASKSSADDSLSNSFLELGATSYLGYTDHVRYGFARSHGIAAFRHLLKNGRYRGIPGLNARENDADPAQFKLRSQNRNARLVPQCYDIRDYDVFITYSWPQLYRDLDTHTIFVGGHVGWSTANNSPYMVWSGDNTSNGGRETVRVNVYAAQRAGRFTNSANIRLEAGWYQPAGGQGPALITVALRNRSTGQLVNVVSKRTGTLPSQTSAAYYPVGTVTVQVIGTDLFFTLT